MRSVELNKGLVTRLNRIEGQIKGIKRMVESGEECEDIMIQILAIQGAIRQVGQKVVMNHLNNCIVESIQTGNLDEVQKFSKILDKFIAK
ncbi:MAG: metal-sensitive transcriptional regulator [Clostridiales bacterium]|jgi:DNA-binding FrmR family transcriptional regulator|nr:metal-sensitive transcriptional regulator [Clostridiales bacterium]